MELPPPKEGVWEYMYVKKIEYVIKNWNENNKIKSEIDVIHVGIYILRATAVIFFTKIWKKKRKKYFPCGLFSHHVYIGLSHFVYIIMLYTYS